MYFWTMKIENESDPKIALLEILMRIWMDNDKWKTGKFI